jgi:hypothetical protein
MEALDQSDLESDNEDEEVIDSITIAVNAGATLNSPRSALISRKRNIPMNKGNNKQQGNAKTTNVSAWDRLKDYPNPTPCCGKWEA